MNTSIKECLSFGWRMFKERSWFLIGVTAITLFFWGIAQNIPILGFVVELFVGMGVITFYLKAHDSVSSVTLKDLWNPAPFWRYLLLTVTYFLAFAVVMIPLGLLAYAGFLSFEGAQAAGIENVFMFVVLPIVMLLAAVLLILLTIPFVWSPIFVVEKGMDVIDALKASWNMSKGHRAHQVGFVVVLGLLNMLGVCALVVGLLITIPVSTLAFVHAYRSVNAASTETEVVPISEEDDSSEDEEIVS